MSFDGHVLTDSGGFQVFSLSPQVDDDGVTFRSVYDGSVHRLTPELAVEVQEALGADIQMALDVCPPLPSPPEVVRLAVERTTTWAARGRSRIGARDKRSSGSCRGVSTSGCAGRVPAGRSTSGLLATASEGLVGRGEMREMLPAVLAAATDELPTDRLRYLMGVGDPVSLVESVAVGVDLFDCVLPSRLGRHGTVLTDGGRINLRNARYAWDHSPISTTRPRARSRRTTPGDTCATCSRPTSPPPDACSACTTSVGC